MRIEYEEYLLGKFPKMYSTVENDPKADANKHLFGFDCNDGWFRLILWLSRYLQSYIDKQNRWAEQYPDSHPKVDQIVVLEVKEKFGTLRFNTSGGNEHTQSAIAFTEYISGFICETTGMTDNVGYNKNNRIKTHHKSLAKGNDFHFVDELKLRKIIDGQKEFNFDL